MWSIFTFSNGLYVSPVEVREPQCPLSSFENDDNIKLQWHKEMRLHLVWNVYMLHDYKKLQWEAYAVRNPLISELIIPSVCTKRWSTGGMPIPLHSRYPLCSEVASGGSATSAYLTVMPPLSCKEILSFSGLLYNVFNSRAKTLLWVLFYIKMYVLFMTTKINLLRKILDIWELSFYISILFYYLQTRISWEFSC